MYALQNSDGTGDFQFVGIIVGSCCSKFSHPPRRTSRDPTELSVARHAVRSRQPADHERQSRAVRSRRARDRVVPLPRPQPIPGSEGPYLDFHEVIRWNDEVAKSRLRDGRVGSPARRRGCAEVRIEGVSTRGGEDQGDLARVDWTVFRENLPD